MAAVCYDINHSCGASSNVSHFLILHFKIDLQIEVFYNLFLIALVIDLFGSLRIPFYFDLFTDGLICSITKS